VIDIPALPAVEMKSLEESSPEMPYIPGVTPEYIRYLSMRWGIGAMPFSNRPLREMGGWMRLRDAVEEPVTEAHLLALVDAWPPATLPWLNKPAAGSYYGGTIEFVQPVASLSTLDWCKYCAVIEHSRDGYGHTAACTWNAAGELLAISRQTVTVFA